MKRWTSLWGHMEEESPLKIGQLVYPGDYIGHMGSSGKSTANHCHLGLISGIRSFLFKMKDVEVSEELIQQLGYFVEDEAIFHVETHITSYFGDPIYRKRFGVFHKGYDIVPIDRFQTEDHFGMHWPRTKTGQVMNIGYDKEGYGHYVLISYSI